MTQKQYSFLTSLINLKIDQPIGSNWTIAGDLKISNTQSMAKRLVTESIREHIGTLEVNHILSGRPFVYSVSEYPVEDTSEQKQLEVLLSRLAHTQMFVNMLWLVKDNSVNFELGFLQFPYIREGQLARVSSNSLSARFSDATGSYDESTFSEAELNQAIELYKAFFGWTHDVYTVPEYPPVSLGKQDRLSRALYFVQAARAGSYLPEKVSYFCTSFESLVSTSASELAHQVAERVAVLIGNNSIEALEIYRNLKRAYDTRSKLVHGGKLTRQYDRYREDSTNCDSYLRRLFRVLISDSDLREAIEQEEEEVNEIFLNRLFSEYRSGGEP